MPIFCPFELTYVALKQLVIRGKLETMSVREIIHRMKVTVFECVCVGGCVCVCSSVIAMVMK